MWTPFFGRYTSAPFLFLFSPLTRATEQSLQLYGNGNAYLTATKRHTNHTDGIAFQKLVNLVWHSFVRVAAREGYDKDEDWKQVAFIP